MIASQNVVEEAVADSTTGDDFDSLLAMSLATVVNSSEQSTKHREKPSLTSSRSVNKHVGESATSFDNELNIFLEEEEGELFSDDEQKVAAGKLRGNLGSEHKREDSIHTSRRLSSYRSPSGSETDSESTGFATGSNSDLQYYGKVRNSSHSNSPVKHKSSLSHRLGMSISPQSWHKPAKFRLGTKHDPIPTLESVAPRVDPTMSVPEDLTSFSAALKTGRISTNSNRDEVWVKRKKEIHKSKNKNPFMGAVQHSTTRELTTLSRAPKMKSKGSKVISKVPGDENRGVFLDDDDDDDEILEKYLKYKSTRKVTMHANKRNVSNSKERSSSISRERSLNLHSGLIEKRTQFDKKRLMKMAIEESNREERKNHLYNAKGVKAKDTSWKNLSSSSDDDFVDPNMIRRKSLKSVKKERSPRKVSRRKERPSSKAISGKKQVRSAIVLADFTNSPLVAEPAETPLAQKVVDGTPSEPPVTRESTETNEKQEEDRKLEDCTDSQTKSEDLLPKDSIEDISSASEVEAGEEKDEEEENLPVPNNDKPSLGVPEEDKSEAKLQSQKVRNLRNPSVSSSSSSSGSGTSDDSSSDSSSSSDDEKGSGSSSSSSSSSDNEDHCQNGRSGPNRHQKMTIAKAGVSQNINRKRHYSSETDSESDSEGGETMRCVVQRLPLEPKQVHAMRSKSPAAQSMLIPELIPRKAPSSVGDIYRLEKTRLGIAKDPAPKLASKLDSNRKSLASSVGSNEDANDKSVASKSPSEESGNNKESNVVKIEAEALDIPKPWRKTENSAKMAKPSPPVDDKKPNFPKNEVAEKNNVQRPAKTTVTELVVSEPKAQEAAIETTSSLSSQTTSVDAVPIVSAELSTVCNTSNVYQTPILASNPFITVDQQEHTLVHMPISETTPSNPFGLTCNTLTPIPGVPLPVPAPVPPPAATVTFCDDYGNQPFYQLANQNLEPPSVTAANLTASQPFYSLDQSSLQEIIPPPNLFVGTNFVQGNQTWPETQVIPPGPDFPVLGNGCGSFEPMSQQFVDPSFLTSQSKVSSSSANQSTIFPPKEPIFLPNEPPLLPKEVLPPKEPVFPPRLESFTQPDKLSGNIVCQAPAPLEKPFRCVPELPKGIKSEQETVVGKYLPWYDPNTCVAPSLSEMLPYFSHFWDVFMVQDNSDAKSARQVVVGLLESAIKFQESQGLIVDPQLKMISEMMKSFRNLENV